MSDLPKINKNDIIVSVAKSVGGIVPFAGNLISEILEQGLKPRLTTGMDIWMRGVSKRLENIEKDSSEIIISRLSNNEEFISILIEASQRAMKTHLPERRLILQNIIINSLKEKYTFEDQTLFLTYLDRLSEAHIVILNYLNENCKFIKGEIKKGYESREINELVTPKNSNISYQLQQELSNLVFIDFTTIENKGYPYLSSYGKEFYEYILT